MFLIVITYSKPFEIVEPFVAAHRAYLQECYKRDCFIVSGPRNPRIGGILLSQLTDREQLMDIIKHDPYTINDVADYEVMEFNPVMFHEKFADFIP